MQSIVYMLDMMPVPAQRPRFHGNHAYDAQKMLKTDLSLLLAHQHNNRPQFKGPVRVDFDFHFAISKKARDKHKLNCYQPTRPDIDNLVKLYLDIVVRAEILNDDNQVAELHAVKHYTKTNKVLFRLQELAEEYNGPAFEIVF